MIDLVALRARHARTDVSMRAWPAVDPVMEQAHADRAALLDELDLVTERCEGWKRQCGLWQDRQEAANAEMLRALAHAAQLEADRNAHRDALDYAKAQLARLDGDRAALLAALDATATERPDPETPPGSSQSTARDVSEVGPVVYADETGCVCRPCMTARLHAAQAALDRLASATERRDPPVPGSSANVLPVRLHQVGPEDAAIARLQAALDRLAAVRRKGLQGLQG